MKYALLLLAFTAFYKTHAQKVVAAATKQAVVYVGVPNPIDIGVEGYKCSELSVRVDTGQLWPTGIDCSYTLLAKGVDTTNVIIASKKTGKELGRVPFETKFIPNPTAFVAGKSGGVIKKSLFKVQMGVAAVLQNFNFDTRFLVTGFDISVIRNSKTIYAEKNIGALFSDNAKAMFETLEGQDEVRIEHIKAVGPDARTKEPAPIIFTITQQ